MDIDQILAAIADNRMRITDHADEEAQADNLSFDEIFGSVLRGEVVEDYPDDWPYPSCLICGETFDGDPVHSVWAYNEENGWAVLVTVYRPDPDRWIGSFCPLYSGIIKCQIIFQGTFPKVACVGLIPNFPVLNLQSAFHIQVMDGLIDQFLPHSKIVWQAH